MGNAFALILIDLFAIVITAAILIWHNRRTKPPTAIDFHPFDDLQ